MPTRTLGIKFQVVGITEVKNSLSYLRKRLNLFLAENKKAANSIVRFDGRLPNNKKPVPSRRKKAQGETGNILEDSNSSPKVISNNKNEYRQQGKIIAETIKFALDDNEDDFIANYQKAFRQIKQGNIKGGVLQYAKKPVNSILAGYYESIGGEFGSIVGQKLLGIGASKVSSFKNREQNKNSANNRILVDLNPQQFKSFAEIIRSSFYSGSRNTNFSISGQPQSIVEPSESLLDKAIKPIKFRFDAISSGYFEGVGNFFGEEFASGLDEVLKEELDISQKRKGRILGKTISFVADDGLDNLRDKFNTLVYTIADLQDETEELDLGKIQTFITALIGIPNSLVDSSLTGFRRASIKEEATRKVDPSQANFNENIENIEDYSQAVITVSGYAGRQGRQGREQAQTLTELNEDSETIVLSSDSPFTDVLLEANDLASGAAWGVNAVANAAKINLKGFNPDAVELVNKVLALRQKNPEIKIKIVGHSAGGFVAEEAQYLLELLDEGNVETVTLGTPNLKGGLKPENIRRIFAENDPLEALHQIAGLIDFVESDTTEYDSIPEGHFFDQYLASDNVRTAIFDRPTSRRPQQTNSNINPPPPIDDIARETLYTVGDAVATALETEGSPSERAQAAQEVILQALNDYQSRVEAAVENQVELANDAAQETAQNLETAINNPQLFTQQQFQGLSSLIEANLERFFDLALQLIASGVDFGLRSYRRQALTDVGQRQVYNRAQEILRENRPRTGARATSDHRQFFATTGGYAGARGLSGDRIARSIRRQVDDAYVIHVPNSRSDVPQSALQDHEERPAAWLNSLGRPNLRGYNPDAIEIAAQALAAHLQNPEIEIKIVGESAGGYIAEEAVHLLNLLGVPNVSGIGVGNPNLVGGINASNFTRLVSPDESLGREAHEVWSRYHLANVSDPNQNIRGVGEHSYESYENTAELQNFILGQPGLTSRGRGRQIRDISQQFLEQSTQEMSPSQRDDLVSMARHNLTQVQRRIPQATGESLIYLQEANDNFQDFFEILTSGSERLEAYRSLLTRARNEIEQRTERPTPSNLTYLQGISDDIGLYRQQYQDLSQGDDSRRFSVIDGELEELQRGITEFISHSLAVPRERIVRKYRRYLQTRSDLSPIELNDFVQTRRQDYEGLSREGKQEYIANVQSSINSRIQDYRQAVNSNNLELAQNIADSLLPQIALIKEVYKDIASSLPSEDALRNSIAGSQGYLTSVETEIIEGSNASGRINVGLPDILAREIELAQSGEQAANGFIEGVVSQLDAVEAAGVDLGQAVQDGTDENLEIRSPAREFIRKGMYVIQGLINGITSGFQEVRDTGSELGEELSEGVEDAEEPNLLNKIKSWFGEFETNFPLLAKYKGLIGGILAGVLGLAGVNLGITALSNLGTEALATAMAIESLNKAILFTSRNSIEGVKNIELGTN